MFFLLPWTLAGLFLLGVARKGSPGEGAEGPKKRSWAAPPEAKARKNPVPADAASLSEGRDLYDEHCNMCHGETGRGDGSMADTLKKKPGNLTDRKAMGELTDGEIWWRISVGDEVMPSFEKEKPLSEKERWNLVNYVRTLAKPAKK